jgi:hypothetical protein
MVMWTDWAQEVLVVELNIVANGRRVTSGYSHEMAVAYSLVTRIAWL